MTDIATTNGHQKTGRKKTLTEAEALAAITAANDQVRSAQQALDKCVTDQAAKKAAHEAASDATRDAAGKLAIALAVQAEATAALLKVRPS